MKLTRPSFSHCLSKPWTDRFVLVNGKQPHATNCTLHMCTAISTGQKQPWAAHSFPKATQRGALGTRVCATMHCLRVMAVSMGKVLAIPRSWYSTGFLAEFGVISGQIWYIVTLCNTSAGKFFSTCHCKLSVSSCKRAFDEQFVFLHSAFRCASSRFSFSALSSLISWGLVQQYRLRIAIFEQAKYTRAEEGEKMLSSLRVSPSSRVAIFTRALVLRSHFYSWGKWRDHL